MRVHCPRQERELDKNANGPMLLSSMKAQPSVIWATSVSKSMILVSLNRYEINCLPTAMDKVKSKHNKISLSSKITKYGCVVIFAQILLRIYKKT